MKRKIISVIILLILLGILLNGNPLFPTDKGTTKSATSSRPNPVELLKETNEERVKRDLPELRADERLAKSAETKCHDMQREGYFGHDTPSGQTFYSFIRKERPNATTVSENLAEGFDTSQQVVDGWMASPLHKQNIVDERVQAVGFAVCDAPLYKDIVVQHFASDS